MFLISTADRRFWHETPPVLFLGEWCRSWPLREVWSRLKHEVLPYHWDDRAKLQADVAHLEEMYERYLIQLAGILNREHGVDRSVRYWRIIIGPWLSAFLSIAFDRWESVRIASASGRVSSTRIGRYRDADWVVRDHLDFSRVCSTDAYNQFLISAIVRASARFPYQEIDIEEGIWSEVQRFEPKPPTSIRGRIIGVIERLAPFVPSRLNRIVLIDSCLAPRDLARLQLSLGQAPYLLQPQVRRAVMKVEPTRRAALSIAGRETPFEQWVSRFVVECLPTSYLEGFAETRRRVLHAYPKRAEVIFTAYAYDANEPFKFWAAEQVANGTRLVGTQHGCHYGTALWFQEESHQLAVYDTFYSWGWSDPTYPNVAPLAAAKFNGIQRTVKPAPEGGILYAAYVWPRYAYKLYAVPIAASGTTAILEEQFRFVRALPDDVRRDVLVRLFPNDRDWGQRERWSTAVPGVRCYLGTADSMFTQMNRSRLLVCFGGTTPHLEALAADYPCIAHLPGNWFELRENARPHYDALRRAGMLFDTPEEAAAQVEALGRDVGAWWSSAPVRDARRQFCDQFARTSPQWRAEWRREFRQLAVRSYA